MRRPLILLSFCLFGSPVMAHCWSEPPSCPLADGRMAYLWTHFESDVMFLEADIEAPPETDRFVLVQCTSRKGLIAGGEEERGDGFQIAIDEMVAAIDAQQPLSLPDLAEAIRAVGGEAQPYTLPPDHCGCELTQMEDPEAFCHEE